MILAPWQELSRSVQMSVGLENGLEMRRYVVSCGRCRLYVKSGCLVCRLGLKSVAAQTTSQDGAITLTSPMPVRTRLNLVTPGFQIVMERCPGR